METRESELTRVLDNLASELPRPYWVALVDHDGLVVACVPPEPPIEPDRISAMTAASTMMGERVLAELDGGTLRYASLAGAKRQLLTVSLGPEHFLSIGLGPEVSPRATFGPLSKRVPEVIRAMKKRFTTQEEV